jgi:hypothetical protein
MVVSTLEAAPAREAEFFAQELVARDLHLGAIVLNKVLPGYLRDPEATRVADAVRDRAPALAEGLSPEPQLAARVLQEVAESFLNFGVVARREAEQRAEWATVPEVLATVPFFADDICDLGGLLELGAQIWD